ncbi:MAG: hypothetical protein Q4A78_04195 [Peptostreptococcaceae bacterium]|nr:hypothetical protein [Peptostreptococcaceae bacterium]
MKIGGGSGVKGKGELRFRFAERRDTDLILLFIRELAEYEQLLNEVVDFYISLGAEPMEEWTVYRIAGERLQQMADELLI